MALRNMGDFGGFVTEQENVFSAFINKYKALGRLGKKLYIFIRQSNSDMLGGARRGFAMEQAKQRATLIEAGVSPDQIVEIVELNKSGALSRKERELMRSMTEACERGEVSGIVVVEISRFYRMPDMTEPTEFSNMLGAQNIWIIRAKAGHYSDLDMSIHDAKVQFRREAEEAAQERLTDRHRTMSARENHVANGSAGSCPTPLGWQKLPPTPAYASNDGMYHPGRYAIYQPHADLKLAIMRLAMEPHIRSWAQLLDAVIERNLTIPPFDKSIALYNYTRSAIHRMKQPDPESPTKHRPPRIDEKITPGVVALRGILLEPLAIGHRYYGSGRTGAQKMNVERAKIDLSKQQCYALIMEGKQRITDEPENALLHGYEQDLFWQVVEKWSAIDYAQVAKLGKLDYSENGVNLPKNQKRNEAIKQPGRARGSEMVNCWAGKVFCARHGTDKEGRVLLTHSMRMTSGKHQIWDCSRDNRRRDSNTICSVVGDFNRLGRTLEAHLVHSIRGWLTSNHEFLGSLTAQRNAAKAKASHLAERIEQLKQELVIQNIMLDGKIRQWMSIEPSTRDRKIDEWNNRVIAPLERAIADKENDFAEAERASLTTPADLSETELRSYLYCIEHWQSLSTKQKRAVIELFIDHVEVLASDGVESRVVLIEIVWNNVAGAGRQGDVLITWKNSGDDKREFTREEDRALEELWPASSGANYLDIVARLQHGRRFAKVHRRVAELGLLDGSRTVAWRKAAAQLEHEIPERRPDLLYFFAAHSPMSEVVEIKNWLNGGMPIKNLWATQEGGLPYLDEVNESEIEQLRKSVISLIVANTPEAKMQLILAEQTPKNRSARQPFCREHTGRAGVCLGSRTG